MTSPEASADKAAQDAIEGRIPGQSGKEPKPQSEAPPAGPHADPALTNSDATPGTGYLSSPGEDDETEPPGG